MRHVRHAKLRSRLSAAKGLVPDRMEVPARYWSMRVLGVLEPEVARLPEWVRADGVSLDIGANYGPYTYALARLSSQVHAFEPNPACARVLREWDRSNVTVHEIALSDRDGTAHLQVPTIDGAPRTTQGSIQRQGAGLEVQTRCLDDLSLDRVDFVKVDVEGHELPVVLGARATFASHRPVILMEIAARLLPGDVRVGDVIECVEDLGYVGSLLAPSGEVPARLFDVAAHQPLVDGSRGEGYANMFLFRPNG